MELKGDVVCVCADANLFRLAYVLCARIASCSGGSYDVVLFTEPNPWLDALDSERAFDIRLLNVRDNIPVDAPLERVGAFAYARLFLGDELAGEYRRAVYLDCDMWLSGPLHPLFNLDLEGKAMAGVEDGIFEVPTGNKNSDLFRARKRAIGLSESNRLLNSGMIVFEPDVWHKENVSEAAMRILTGGKYRISHKDQDVINILFKENAQLLSNKWNYMPYYFASGIDLAVRPTLYHFASREKPWHGPIWIYGDQFRCWFDEAFKSSPWSEVAPRRQVAKGYFKRLERSLRIPVRQVKRFIPSKRRHIDQQDEKILQRHKIMAGRLLKDIKEGTLADIRQGLVSVDESILVEISRTGKLASR